MKGFVVALAVLLFPACKKDTPKPIIPIAVYVSCSMCSVQIEQNDEVVLDNTQSTWRDMVFANYGDAIVIHARSLDTASVAAISAFHGSVPMAQGFATHEGAVFAFVVD